MALVSCLSLLFSRILGKTMILMLITFDLGSLIKPLDGRNKGSYGTVQTIVTNVFKIQITLFLLSWNVKLISFHYLEILSYLMMSQSLFSTEYIWLRNNGKIRYQNTPAHTQSWQHISLEIIIILWAGGIVLMTGLYALHWGPKSDPWYTRTKHWNEQNF